MAELQDYLTGIADAIRSKKGTTTPINAKDFASEIEGIAVSNNRLYMNLAQRAELLESTEKLTK